MCFGCCTMHATFSATSRATGSTRNTTRDCIRDRIIRVELSPPSTSVAGHDGLAQQKRAAWRKDTGVEDITLAALNDQLAYVCAFLDPVFLSIAAPSREWNPITRPWN